MQIDDESLSKITESFSSAEKLVKNCENLVNELPQGAVNELRYAATHLISYLKSKNQEELQKFHRHCKRAKYDSQELPVLIFKEKIDILLNRIDGNEDLANDVLGVRYSEILTSRRKYNKVITEAIKNKDNRDDFLEEIEAVLEALQKDWEILETAMPAIQAKIRREGAKNKTATNQNLLSFSNILIASIGVFVVIAVAIWG